MGSYISLDGHHVQDRFTSNKPACLEKYVRYYNVMTDKEKGGNVDVRDLLVGWKASRPRFNQIVYLPNFDVPKTTSRASRLVTVTHVNHSFRQDGVSPLHVAAMMCDRLILQFILDNCELDVDCVTKCGNTPLMEALMSNSGDKVGCVSLLLKRGASIVKQNVCGFSAFTIVAMEGDQKILKKMVERISGAEDFNLTTKSGYTPLMFALMNNHLRTADLMITELNCAMSINDKDNLSPLCWAMLRHPTTAAVYIAIKIVEDGYLEQFFEERLGLIQLEYVNLQLFALVYKEIMLLLLLRPTYSCVQSVKILNAIHGSSMWEHQKEFNEPFKLVYSGPLAGHQLEVKFISLLPWLVALLISIIADIPEVVTSFVENYAASSDLIKVLSQIAAFPGDDKDLDFTQKARRVQLVLLPMFSSIKGCQWIITDVLPNKNMLFYLSQEPESKEQMTETITWFLKQNFESFKIKEVSIILGKAVMKKLCIKIDKPTIAQHIAKPHETLQRCSLKAKLKASEFQEELDKLFAPAKKQTKSPPAKVTVKKTAARSKTVTKATATDTRAKAVDGCNKITKQGSPKKHIPEVPTPLRLNQRNASQRKINSRFVRTYRSTGNATEGRSLKPTCIPIAKAPPPPVENVWEQRKQAAKIKKELPACKPKAKSKLELAQMLDPAILSLGMPQKDQKSAIPAGSVCDNRSKAAAPSVDKKQKSVVSEPSTAEKNLDRQCKDVKDIRNQQMTKAKAMLKEQAQKESFFPSAYVSETELLKGVDCFVESKPAKEKQNIAKCEATTKTPPKTSISERTKSQGEQVNKIKQPSNCQNNQQGNQDFEQFSKQENSSTSRLNAGMSQGDCLITSPKTETQIEKTDTSKEVEGIEGMSSPAEIRSLSTSSGLGSQPEEVPPSLKEAFRENWIPSSKRWRPHLEYLQARPQKERQKIGSINFSLKHPKMIIARGSSGTVVTVGIRDDGTEVALKRMLRCNTVMIRNELLNLRSPDLEHPNIVRYKDYVEDEHFAYLALELCEFSLDEYITLIGPEGVAKQGTRLVWQLLKGLSALHSAKILHMDLKPRNVLIDIRGNIRLADFGLSMRMDDEQDTVYQTPGQGTRCWRPPEMLQTGTDICAGRYKPVSDTFVAGIISFYILTSGQHPFGNNASHCEMNISQHKLQVTRHHLSDPLALDLVLACMLEPKMDLRKTAAQCMRHAYFWNAETRFDFICKFASEQEIVSSIACNVVISVNRAQQWMGCKNWYDDLGEDMQQLARSLGVCDNSDVTSLLHFITTADSMYPTWQADLRTKIPDPAHFFMEKFPRLFIAVYEICRESTWSQRRSLRPFFHQLPRSTA